LSTPDEEQIRLLADDFRTYDTNVDVVSAWEMIFTESDTDLRRRVRHFERFPSILAPDGREATPDFSVVFDSGPGLVGEICRFALNEESVEAVCDQIARYDTLRQLPVGGGATVAVPAVDVMLLVPFELGTAAVRRIIRQRLLDPSHRYKPENAPVIVQFELSRSSEKYVFQRRTDSGNGTFREEDVPAGARLSADWFDVDDIKVRPDRIRLIKSTRAFVNDPIPPLYLATFLWAKPFAARAATDARPVTIQVVPAELAEQVRNEYGAVRSRDIESAMALLERGGLAERTIDGWVVYWNELHRSGTERDLADILARRSVRPPRTPPRQPGAEAPDTSGAQERLF
jgi:hypothetical protein